MKNFTNCNTLEYSQNLIKFMNNLKVLNEDDWEEICLYLMRDLVFKNTNVQVSYQRYGRRGERQHGVDLVPIGTDIGVYAQCKHKSMGVLTVNEIFEDLAKTESFPHKIQRFIVLTTSTRDTFVQNQFLINQQPYRHINSKNPEGFPVHIIYWDNIKDLLWLPIEAQNRFFPSLFQHPFINQIESIQALKSVIPKYLNEINILWLENWNFREKNFVYQSDYNPFLNLYLEYDRAKNAIDLAIGYKAELFKAIPSGKEIFNNLEALYLHVHAQMIGDWNEDGQDCLFIRGPDFWVSIYLIKLDQLAKNLATVLRSYVFSQ